MTRRDLMQLLSSLLADGTLGRLGASTATLSLVRLLDAFAQDLPPDSPPAPSPTPEAGPADGLGSLQRAASDAVNSFTKAINTSTNSMLDTLSPNGFSGLVSLTSVTANVEGYARGTIFGDTGSQTYGVAATFNPLTSDYGGEFYKTKAPGASISPPMGLGSGVSAGFGSGDLDGFNGMSRTTTLEAGTDSVSFTTNRNFAGIGIGLTTLLPFPGLVTEQAVTTPLYRIQGNVIQDISRQVINSTSALMNIGQAVMSMVP